MPDILHMLHPEVAGGVGAATVIDNHAALRAGRARVPKVSRLEYTFEGWLGDELLEAFPCFIITEKLGTSLMNSGLTGITLEDTWVSRSELFRELYPRRRLPPFKWLVPQGRVTIPRKGRFTDWSGHDFCVTESAQLVVSGRALEALQLHKIEHCEFSRLRA
jgi:hypothetical protein